MRGELSRALAELTTSGNRIVRADSGEAVLLRGINRSGLEYTEPTADGFLAPAQLTQDEIREMVQKLQRPEGGARQPTCTPSGAGPAISICTPGI
jgi:hypothetical protein